MREDAGFTDIKVGDDSANIRPMLKLFYALAVMMYFFIKLFGLERLFIGTVVGVQGYRHRKHWRYVVITATKPVPRIESARRSDGVMGQHVLDMTMRWVWRTWMDARSQGSKLGVGRIFWIEGALDTQR